MKISIITINLNNKEGLERTIESVLRQTFFDKLEYIIVDGDSTDGSVDVIEKYKDKFSSVTIEKDNGIFNAMNKGIDKANGEYVLFLNSGDEFYSDMSVERCYGELDKDIVYGNLLIMDLEKKYINNPVIKKYPDVVTPKYMAKDALPHNGSFIRLELLKKEKYSEEFSIISDWAFFFKKILIDKCSYKHIDVIVSTFYLGGVSSNSRLDKIERRRFFETILNKPAITIVMPCYNYSRYIPEAIGSLKRSTYSNWECIIVNDGSTDNSEDVIYNEIGDDKRFVYIRQSNKGLSGARNIGIRAAKTRYILCLDPDDKISERYIEDGVRYMDLHGDCTLYYGKAKMFYDDGTEEDWELSEYNYEKLLVCNHIYSSFIFRKSDYEAVGGFDEKMDGYEDWEFLIRLLYGGKKVHMTDDVVFYYRRHEGSKDSLVKSNIEKYLEYILKKNKELVLSTIHASDDKINKEKNVSFEIYGEKR